MDERNLLEQIQLVKKYRPRPQNLFVRVGVYEYDYTFPIEMKRVSSIEYGYAPTEVDIDDKDELVQHLFDLSLHYEIYKLERMFWATDSKGDSCLMGVEVKVRECIGNTNITPDVIEEISDLLTCQYA